MLKVLFVVGLLVAAWLYLRPKKPALSGEAEARQVLGVGPDADEATIRAAHRRLVGAVHPDRGGSADLTRRVNAARDVLLGRLRH
ncbi:J domain-containing protein [Sphingomonas sp. ac-8]|uniref:J domain-containing protein n=1 Tax=Sphingomonas sp. ac-8 TaxID=3242977 RepID=UPI003A80766E